MKTELEALKEGLGHLKSIAQQLKQNNLTSQNI